MKTTILIIVSISVMAAGFAFADQVSLPDLIGEHSGALGERSFAFDFGGDVGEIDSVSLELHGTVNTSWVSVDGDTSIWGGEFMASFMDPEAGFWFGSTHWSLDGEFHTIVTFSSFGGATWDFLSDGQGELLFGFFPAILVGIIDDAGPEPTGAITSATLILERAIATESQSLGQIKSQYR